ncbi:MAG: Ca-activated chloride channel family protein [Marmoricola sp.]|jgi:Ca-activated chloride channel family protein|nr:Ca-activated chloride channel family protein [Marmoricola sp.]
MSFLSPWWLLLLVPVLLLVVAYVLQQRRRSRYAVRFASLPMLERLAPRSPGWRRHLPAALLLLAFVALALAAARPEADVRVPRKNATVIVAIDVSISMRATDVEPSRLEAAAAAATKFVEDLPKGFNIGLVTFSGQTSVRAAPTTDRKEVEAALQNLTLSTRTAIGEGVFTSLDEIKSTAVRAGQKKVPGTVVLLSDGTNTTGRTPQEAAAAARAAGVPVSTIAYGTQSGTVELEGQLVPVPVDRETLATLARDAGGRAYTAETSNELDNVYDNIRSSIGLRTETREITQYFAALALFLGLVAAGLSLRWFARLP